MKRGLALLRISAAAVLATVAPTVAAAATPVQRTFSDWMVTCDNGLRCVALGGKDDGGRMLMLMRDAGPDGDVSVEVGGIGEDFVDGRAVHYPTPQWRHDEEDGIQLRRTTDLEAAQQLVDNIRNGSRLHAGDDADGEGISLRGLSAALLFIDEAQGRLGTRGALLRRGDKAESSVPAAPPLPQVRPSPASLPLSDADATRLTTVVRKTQAEVLAKEECNEEPPFNSDQAWPLTDTDALVHLGCWMGAYQASGLLFRVPRTQPAKAVRLSLPSLPGEPPMTMLTTADYEPAGAQLHHFAKGRGIGDCGESADWVFDGNAFVLAGYTAMEQCIGARFAYWPTRWRSRIVEGISK